MTKHEKINDNNFPKLQHVARPNSIHPKRQLYAIFVKKKNVVMYAKLGHLSEFPRDQKMVKVSHNEQLTQKMPRVIYLVP